MKHLKTKLMAALASLVVATVAMTSVSFAWFTISTAPEVSNIKTKVAANGNLEIALANDVDFTTAPDASDVGDTGKNTTWGNLVDLTSYFNENSGKQLVPIQLDGATESPYAVTAKSPSFGLDGRIVELVTLETKWLSGTVDANASFTDGGATIIVDDADAATPNFYAYRIDLFVRTNTAGDIKLLTAAGTDRGAGETGLGSYLKGSDAAAAAIQVSYKSGDNTTYQQLIKLTRAEDDENGIGRLSAGADDVIISNAVANQVYHVSIYIYADGDEATTNETLGNVATDLEANIQFCHSETLANMDLEGTDNGRQ